MVHHELSNRILFVDDDPQARFLLRTAAQHWRCILDTATCAEEALILTKQNSYELYILDYWMPHVNGIELLAQIRTIDPKAIVIFLSADSRAATREVVSYLGVHAFVTKPF